MSVASQTPSHQCPVCTMVGLPIMPLRYALAWAGEDVPEGKHAPRVDAPFDAGTYPDLGTASAYYTLRMLRAGYLYVYDEARREWSSYEVASDGSLFAFEIDDGPSPGGKPAPDMCSRAISPSLARCIQVKDAAKASKLWLSHSDAQWTAAVKASHDEAAYRSKHMSCIDVGGWFQSNGKRTQAHLSTLKDVFERVSEYALPAAEALYFDKLERDRGSAGVGAVNMRGMNVSPQPAFMLSSYDFAARDRSDFKGVLWGKNPDTAPPDQPFAMVALDDPVGITSEIAELMNDRLDALMSQPDRVRPLAASAAILQLRDAVEHQTVLKAGEAMQAAADSLGDYADFRAGMGSGDPMRESIPLTAEDLKRVRSGAWKSNGYQERYDEAKRAEWQLAHDKELQALDEAVIAPLAGAHVKLLESLNLQVHLQCNYDPNHALSGAAYLGTVLSCIVDTQDKVPQMELYARWLESSPQDKNNLLLRAYTLNQDQLADEVSKAAESAGAMDWGSLPWSTLFGLYGTALAASEGAANIYVARLIKETIGPVAKLLSKVVDGPVKLYGVLAWGMAGKMPLEKVTLMGKKSGDIVRQVMASMERATGRRTPYQAVHAELRR
ncbi:MAG: T6SS effector BTH_I2691 family protein [Stenotrophomonas sp.]|uniref:T6SS effector BTH_I2691 family protein n=1 Tax=Stenotrophomonas sp. TaxID=69392 RepID=UPI003D6CFAA6